MWVIWIMRLRPESGCREQRAQPVTSEGKKSESSFLKASPHRAVVAEWLRRLTRNQIPYGSAGSNPAGCVYFFALNLVFCLHLPLFSDHHWGPPGTRGQWSVSALDNARLPDTGDAVITRLTHTFTPAHHPEMIPTRAHAHQVNKVWEVSLL